VATREIAPMALSFVTLDRKRIAVAALLLAIIGIAVYSIVTAFLSHPDYRAAQEAASRRDFEGAGRLVQRYLQEYPADRAAWLLAAQTARRQGKLADAAQNLDAYTRLAGQNAEGDFEKCLLRVQSGEVDEGEKLLAKNPAQKSAMLEAIIEGYLNRLLLGLHHELGMTGQGEISTADYARAHDAVDQWLDSCVDRVDQTQGYVWRGKLYAVAKDYPKAHVAFRKALELDPDHRAARENLGLLLVADTPQEAARHLQLARKQDAANVTIGYNLAITYRALGEHEQARTLLDELLEAHPNDSALLVERALVAMDERRLPDAEFLLERALRAFPGHVQGNLLYSQVLQQRGRSVEAQRYHDKYLELQAQMKRQQEAK
jgi:predicted Zn-dependent protease